MNANRPGEGQELREPGTPVIEYDIATGRERTLVEPGGYTQVSFPDAPDAYITGGAVSPDGDKIAYQVFGGRSTPADERRSIEIFSLSSGEIHVIKGLARGIGSSWSVDSRS